MKFVIRESKTEILERVIKGRFYKRFLKETSLEELNFLVQLPVYITDILLEKSQQPSDKEIVKKYFREHSFISKVLMKNPATFKMLELIYTGKDIQGAIDRYAFNSPSGQALQNRLSSVIDSARTIIKMKVNRGIKVKVVNFGSGSGRDTIEVLAGNSYLTNSVSIDCVDIDPEALQKGKELMKRRNLTGITFIQGDLIRLAYRKEIDLGLMIGVLCGLEHRACIAVLKRIKRYFKKGAILMASNVLKSMPEKDPFTSYLLEGIIGWRLIYKTPEEIRQIFEKAGYEWRGIFYDEPTRFHGMGVGVVPFT